LILTYTLKYDKYFMLSLTHLVYLFVIKKRTRIAAAEEPVYDTV